MSAVFHATVVRNCAKIIGVRRGAEPHDSRFKTARPFPTVFIFSLGPPPDLGQNCKTLPPIS